MAAAEKLKREQEAETERVSSMHVSSFCETESYDLILNLLCLRIESTSKAQTA